MSVDDINEILSPIAKNWIEDSPDELAQKIRYYRAVVNFDPMNCIDAEKYLKDCLYEVVFSEPWKRNETSDYLEYIIEYGNDIVKLPYFNIQLSLCNGFGEVLRSDLTDDIMEGDNPAYKVAMKVVEETILSHALCGVDICDEKYIAGIEAIVEECEEIYG